MVTVIPGTSLRLVDANLNRLTEALKLVEDLCRFALDDHELAAQVRALRSDLNPVIIPLRRAVLPYRNSQCDPGRMRGFDRAKRQDIAAVLQANLKRVQEAARVLEEITKVRLPHSGLPGERAPAMFKSARFRGYDLEKSILGKLDRTAVFREPQRGEAADARASSCRQAPRRQTQTGKHVEAALLYVVMDTATIGRRNLARIARELVRTGVKLIQLREPKDLPTRAFIRDARTILAVSHGTGTKLIVNDRVDVARATDADGVHLGQDDMPFAAARKLLPADKIIGVSVSTAAQARRAETAGADYLGAGALFATPSKDDARVIGLAGLRAIRRVTRLPIIAIGGIDAENAPSVLRAGARGIAVIAAVFGGGAVSENVAKLRAALRRHHSKLLKDYDLRFTARISGRRL